MNTLEFSKNIPPEKLATIFRQYFEEHMAMYYMLKGVDFVSINNVDTDSTSIMYSVRVLDEIQKDELVKKLQNKSTAVNIYGHVVYPEIYINGDLLCITIRKN
jgi:hypothetical protein